MRTRIIEREDIKVMPSITSLHGPKGVLGNQEIGGSLPFCIVEEVIQDDEDVVVSTGDHAHACITVGGGQSNGNCDSENRTRVCPAVRVTPTLCGSDYKGFTRTQNIMEGCAFLIVEVVDG